MGYEPKKHAGRSRRLEPEAYRGDAWVHWVMTIEGRKSGWLSELSHSRIREALVHTLARYRLICPVYCLMPDHMHFLFGGLAKDTDQRNAVKFFRRELNRILGEANGGFRLEKQPYDHVLNEKESQRCAFEEVSCYIVDNPVRAGLGAVGSDWEFSGCVVVGYPDMHPLREGFWDRFWKIYQQQRDDAV